MEVRHEEGYHADGACGEACQEEDSHAGEKRVWKTDRSWTATKRTALVYATWTALHQMAANMYPEHCAPATLQGFFMSTVLAPSPQCVAMRWCINKGSSAMVSMWVVLGTWFASHMVISN